MVILFSSGMDCVERGEDLLMMKKRPVSRDLFDRFLFFFLVFLLAVLVAAQIGLAIPSFRPKLSRVEALEGVRLRGWPPEDLPSAADLW